MGQFTLPQPAGGTHGPQAAPRHTASPATGASDRVRAARCAQAIRRQRRRLETELDLLRSIRLEARERRWGSLPHGLTEAIAALDACQARLRAATAWFDQHVTAPDVETEPEGAADAR